MRTGDHRTVHNSHVRVLVRVLVRVRVRVRSQLGMGTVIMATYITSMVGSQMLPPYKAGQLPTVSLSLPVWNLSLVSFSVCLCQHKGIVRSDTQTITQQGAAFSLTNTHTHTHHRCRPIFG